MRTGIRLQLLLALAGVMALAFVPLYVAVASLTQVTLRNVRMSSARSLGRAVAAHVCEARRTHLDSTLQPLLDSEIGAAGLDAIGVYGTDGRSVARAGETHVLAHLPEQVPVDTERTRTFKTVRGSALEVLVPGAGGPVVAVVRTDDEIVKGGPLLRLVGMYTGVFALALLVFTYFALTRLLVRPIDELSAAARHVTEGARSLEVPRRGAREILELSQSLAEMTRRIRAEEQALREKIEELERTTQELTSAQHTIVRSERLASVGRLAAGLAHEIGNPIAAILGLEELLLSGGLEPAEQRDFLERMKKETERIHRVLRQLLDFARPTAAEQAQEQEPPGSVSEAIEDACSLVSPHKSFRSLDLSLEIAPDLPLVKLSRSAITQVLLNLLFNAADAAGAGGKIIVRAMACEIGVRIEVQDNGPGIRDDIKDKLFEPFATTKDVGAGTGLGLAICRGLVEAAGGTIAAQNRLDGGALFCFNVPCAEK